MSFTSSLVHFEISKYVRESAPAALLAAKPGDVVTFRMVGSTEVETGVFRTLGWRKFPDMIVPMVHFTNRDSLPFEEAAEIAVAAPALPDCATFTGSGQRCTSCRVRKAMHA